MSRRIAGLAAALAFTTFALPSLASAATLTESQINAIVGLLQSFGASSSVISNVEATLTGSAPAPSSSCVNLTHDMTLGSTDATTGDDVSILQNFLASRSYFTYSGGSTGYYGFVTAQAVGQFQLQHGIVSSANDPAYGITGPQTRSAIYSASCSGSTTSAVSTYPSTSNISGTQSTTQTSPVITGTDSTGQITPGARVVINGTGFDAGSYVIFDGNQSINPIPETLTSTSFVFYVPSSAALGTHTIQVGEKASGETSNTVTITVQPAITAPFIISINPTSIVPGNLVTIYGTNLANGNPAIEFVNAQGVLVGKIYFVDMNNISNQQVSFAFSGKVDATDGSLVTLTPGTYKIDVVTPNGTSNTISVTFAASVLSTITSPVSGQSFALGNDMTISWSPASMGVAAISLVPTNGGSEIFIYSMKVNSDPVNYSGSWTYSLPLAGITPGSYYLKFYNPEPYAGSNQGPGTVIGQSSVFTIASPNPTVNSVVPVSGSALIPGQEASIEGSGFDQGSIVVIDGAQVPTTYSSPVSLRFVVPSTATSGSHTVSVTEKAGPNSNTITFSVVVPAPVINSFSVNSSQQFSLSAYNYSTITFQAQCGNFVAEILSSNYTASYPTGSVSICNAPQYYYKSSANADPSTPPIYNEPLHLWNQQGTLDGSTTFVANPPTSNNSGSASLTVNVCNTAGKCVQQSATFPIYGKACLAAGTKISMADGSYKNIESIKVGDLVKSSGGGSGTVAKVVQREDPLVTINGVLEAAPDEVVYLADGTTKLAGLVKVGDRLLGENGQAVAVTTIKSSSELTKTYDLSLVNAHTFFADGYLVQALAQ